MKVVLDTHVFLWAALEPKRLSGKLRRLLLEGDQRAILSVASIWEIAIKVNFGKLPIPKPTEWLRASIADLNLMILPVRENHAIRTLTLPDHHKDPFDRIIVAQAIEEELAIATVDDQLKRYAVNIFW